MENAHTKACEEIIRYYDIKEDGLTEQQVLSNREKFGLNGI